MKRHTWFALFFASVLASVGYCGLRRGSWRTAFRYRLIERVMDRTPEDATELRHWSRKDAA